MCGVREVPYSATSLDIIVQGPRSKRPAPEPLWVFDNGRPQTSAPSVMSNGARSRLSISSCRYKRIHNASRVCNLLVLGTNSSHHVYNVVASIRLHWRGGTYRKPMKIAYATGQLGVWDRVVRL
ncbi:hypothetical protein CC77DRAFT_786918 [Alternaria alternata]|jgi:hypothetical protein|uniref:Uncharacterized protein n=1 Tax=Alternaria alternata TaxID=5599 RepID=A0A177DRL9_ALTAL|nr:hypothetical protein CC77DRAFT_786918 [Alternaria alternata]OAG22147.1 hypothetical protein CC77DRAFT_786918 [Alternaria alternata]